MNSRKPNLKLTENITVSQVPNTASLSNSEISSQLSFLKKMIFQVMFEIIK